jgi:hypothetical protein
MPRGLFTASQAHITCQAYYFPALHQLDAQITADSVCRAR